MLPQKKFSTFSEQVEWLQDEKHLIISDRQYAEDVLKHIGYFPLMGGYKHLFRIPLTKKYKDGVSRLIVTLQRATSTTDYVYINYYRNTYGNIPLQVLINVLTFGNLSKMYKVFPLSLQSKVCKNIGIINLKQNVNNFFITFF